MNNELKTSRVEALCDGIFAIAMTLLIVGFNEVLNWPKSLNEAELYGKMMEILPDIAYYAQSFIILAAFWVEHHHQFHYIKHTNLTLLFINLIAFMFIALIPFFTLVMDDYGLTRIAAALFNVNLLCAGALFYAHWAYAVNTPGMVDPSLDSKTIEFYKRKNLVIPVVSLIAIGVSFINPRVGSSMYFAVPVIILLLKK